MKAKQEKKITDKQNQETERQKPKTIKRYHNKALGVDYIKWAI